MNHFFSRIATVSLLWLGLSASVQAEILPSSVHLQAYGTHEGSNIVYHYKLINNSNETLRHFVVGSAFSSKMGYEIPQLERLPLGWRYGKESETGTAIILAQNSTSQPPSWIPHVYGQEEIDYYYLEWKTKPDGQSYAIQPGQSLAGFSVSIPLYDPNEAPPDYFNAAQVVGEQDDIYLTGSFKVSYWDSTKNELKNVWGPIEIADKTPPTLSITLSPSKLWPPNGKMVPITAMITVTDNYDPQPEINLVSITCNEPMDKDDIKAGKLFTDIRQFQLKAGREGGNKAGRIYTVTYIAIDASGNQTMASAIVTVPHDRDDKEQHEDHDNKDDKKNSWGTTLKPFSKQK
jgi:hypothetical protein